MNDYAPSLINGDEVCCDTCGDAIDFTQEALREWQEGKFMYVEHIDCNDPLGYWLEP